MQKISLLVLFLGLCVSCQTELPSNEIAIKEMRKLEMARFQNHRIFIDFQAPGKETVHFFTDTGGGRVIAPATPAKLGIQIDTVGNEENFMEVVNLGPLFAANDLPEPIGTQFVFREENPFKEDNDGMLGANWFANKRWHFNYLKQELSIIDSIDWSLLADKRKVPIGFMQDSLGNNLTHFPSIDIIVDGDTIPTLFDSGATAMLSESAQNHFDGAEMVGTSFIINSHFEKWRDNHPTWKIIPGGDMLIREDMIQVPEVIIGGHTVGPVWFARREDDNFTEFMSQWMDRTVEGAVGGSCFQYFSSIILDYEAGLASFDR